MMTINLQRSEAENLVDMLEARPDSSPGDWGFGIVAIFVCWGDAMATALVLVLWNLLVLWVVFSKNL